MQTSKPKRKPWHIKAEDFNPEVFRHDLRQAGLLDEKNQMEYKDHLTLKNLVRISKMRDGTFSRYCQMPDSQIRIWMESDDYTPYIKTLARIRQKTGVILCFGEIEKNRSFMAKPSGLNSALELRKMSIEDLALELGFNYRYIKRFLSGERLNQGYGMSAKFWRDAARVLKCCFKTPLFSDLWEARNKK